MAGDAPRRRVRRGRGDDPRGGGAGPEPVLREMPFLAAAGSRYTAGAARRPPTRLVGECRVLPPLRAAARHRHRRSRLFSDHARDRSLLRRPAQLKVPFQHALATLRIGSAPDGQSAPVETGHAADRSASGRFFCIRRQLVRYTRGILLLHRRVEDDAAGAGIGGCERPAPVGRRFLAYEWSRRSNPMVARHQLMVSSVLMLRHCAAWKKRKRCRTEKESAGELHHDRILLGRTLKSHRHDPCHDHKGSGVGRQHHSPATSTSSVTALLADAAQQYAHIRTRIHALSTEALTDGRSWPSGYARLW